MSCKFPAIEIMRGSDTGVSYYEHNPKRNKNNNIGNLDSLLEDAGGRADNACIDNLPIAVLRICLSFLGVRDLLCHVELVSTLFRDISVELTGRTKKQEGNSLYFAIPYLVERLAQLRTIRTEFDQICFGTPLQTCSLFTGLNKYRGLKSIEKRRLSCIDDEELIERIFDLLILKKSEKTEFVEEKEKKLKRDIRSCYVTFYEFVQAADIYDNFLKERKEYISKYYIDPEDTDGLTLVQGQLTEYGAKVCREIFNHFDMNQDDALCWEELSALNSAAGIPLTRSAYAWVQEKFETNEDRNLTREGYYALFLDNFKLSPNLMYRDLVMLHKALADRNTGSTGAS